MKLDIVYWGDDWMALYKDGELVAEDHSLRLDIVFDAIGIPTYSIKSFTTEDELLLWDGPPKYLSDIDFNG